MEAIEPHQREIGLHAGHDPRRLLLGETLRRSVQEIEGAEFKVIETTPAKGKNAA
jgi:hypothetical protein